MILLNELSFYSIVCLTTGDDKCPKCHRVRSVNVHLAGDPDNYKLSELLPNPALLDASADNATRDYFTFRHRTYISMSYVVRRLRIYSNNSFQVSANVAAHTTHGRCVEGEPPSAVFF